MYVPDEAHGGQNLALCHLGNDLASVLNPKEVSQLLRRCISDPAFSFMTVVSEINLTVLYIINTTCEMYVRILHCALN